MITALRPGAFAAALVGRSDGVLAEVEVFQACLVTSLKTRFAPLFEESSLALSAVMFLPGPNRFNFQNFPLPPNINALVRVKCIEDVIELLPIDTIDEHKVRARRRAETALIEIREDLDRLDPNIDPFVWIPSHPEYTVVFDLAKELLGIPSSTGEDERTFSSAGNILSKCRTQLDIENFRREHRIRRFLTGGSDAQTSEGSKLRVSRVEKLLDRFNARFGGVNIGQ